MFEKLPWNILGVLLFFLFLVGIHLVERAETNKPTGKEAVEAAIERSRAVPVRIVDHD